MKNYSDCPRLLGALLAFLFIAGSLPLDSQAAVAVTSVPVMGTPASQSTTQNVTLVFSTTNGNAITLTNQDPGADLIQLTLSVTEGTLTLNGTNGLAFTVGDGVADATMTGRGTFTNLNTALNGLRYTTGTNYFASSTLTLSGYNATPVVTNLNTGLQGHYTFDNTSALGADTSPPGTRSGTVTGGTAAVDPWRFNVINLDAAGGADYVQITGHFGNPSNVTLAAWVNMPTAPVNGADVISLGDSAALRLDDVGYMKGIIYDGIAWRSTPYATNLAGTGWRHVAYTFDDAGDLLKLYLDGVPVATRIATGPISYGLGADSFIGKHGNVSTTHNFTGKIDDARVYDRALSASEIASLAGDLNPNLSTTNNVTITVVAPPSITSQPSSQTPIAGTNPALSVTASGTEPISYRWARNGSYISGATNSTLTLTNVSLGASGNYLVELSNNFGSVTSEVAVLNVLPTGTILASQDSILKSSGGGILNYGASTSLIVDSSGGGLGNQRALLQFDLSSIPSGATILNATLQLQVTARSGAIVVEIHRITESWEEGGFLGFLGAANWNQRLDGTSWTSAGGTYDPTVVATLNVSTSVDQPSWDITTLVQGWVVGSYVNNGVLLGSPDGGSKTVTFDSREGTTPPQLLVSYAIPPAITGQPDSQTVDAGTNVSFSANVSGSVPLSYQWARNGANISGATNSSLDLTNVALSASGNYTAVLTNSGGSVTSQVAVLTVQAVPPGIITPPVSQTVAEGANVSFSVTATGTAPLSYQWARNGSNIAGATNSSLNLGNVALSTSGDYAVLILNSGGFAASQAATLTVQPAPPNIIIQPISRTVNEGTNVSFTVTATGTAPLSYQWKSNAVPISGATSASLYLTNVAMSASGNYTVFITNSAGSVTSQVAVLTVLAVAPTITNQPVSRAINDGENVSFSVSATGTAPLSYQWRKDSSVLAGATNTGLSLSNTALTASGNYTVVVTNSAGSVTSQVAVLNILPVPPTIAIQPVSQATTIGSTVILSVTATGSPTLQYRWLRNGVTLPGEVASTLTLANVQAGDAGTYRVLVYNDQGSVSSAGADLTVTVAPLAMTDNFSMEIGSTNFTGTGQSSNMEATAEVDEPLHDGKTGEKSMWFAWQAPASGIATFSTAGSDFDTLLAVYQGDGVNALVPVASDDDEAGFYNSQVQFNAVSNAVYHIAVDGAGGASGTIILQWVLEATTDLLPVITNQPASRIVGVGSNAVFTVALGGVGYDYQWFLDGVPITDGTNSSWNISSAGIPDVGQYRVSVTLGTRTVRSKRAGLQVTLTPDFDQDVLIADKFVDMVQGGRRLRLDPPPSSSLSGLLVSPSGPSRGFSGSQVFSTVGSLKEPGEPDHCGVPGGASQWFAYQAETDGVLAMNTDGSTFDTVLAVYTGPGANFSSLIPLVCDNDSGTNGQTSSLHFITTSGTIYYIAVDGVNGASGTVVLNYTTLGEQQAPSITITSAPPANTRLTNDAVLLSGIATDNTELSAVQWRIANGLGVSAWQTADGTNEWTVSATNLIFGPNSIQIRSLDTWGNESAITSRIYVRLAPLTVSIDGCGSISDGFLGTTYREPGKSVTITAKPCADAIFAGWSGDAVSDGTKLTLLVETGMVFQANFLTNFYAQRPGTYVGLVYDTNVLDYERAGSVSIRTTKKGTYSGKLRIGARKHSFRGSFGIDGLSTNLVSRGRTEPPLELQLDFNLGETIESLTGRLVDTNWTGELLAFRSVFHSRNNPAPYEGRYTLLLAANGMPGTPDGDGYGSVKVSAKGSARIKGALGDGTKFSQGASLSVDGLWPFHVPLRGGSGSVFSWLLFGTNSMLFGTNTVQSDIEGDVRWIALAAPTARYYPDGFTNAIVAAGSRYSPPSGGDNGALSFSNGVVTFSGGNLSAPFTNNVLRSSKDRITNEDANKLSLKISRSSGLLKGSVVVPDTGQKLSFKGALFQNGDFGFGHFLHTNASGAILLAPRE